MPDKPKVEGSGTCVGPSQLPGAVLKTCEALALAESNQTYTDECAGTIQTGAAND